MWQNTNTDESEDLIVDIRNQTYEVQMFLPGVQQNEPVIGQVTRPDSEQTNRTTARLAKAINVMYYCYVVCVVVIATTILIIEWGKECDKPLYLWASVQLGLQVVSVGVNASLSMKICSENPADNEEISTRRMILTRVLKASRSVLNTLWAVWFISGMIWTFSSRSCAQTSPALYNFCLGWIIAHLIVLGLILLCCCCGLVAMFVLYRYQPQLFGIQRPLGVSNKVINSLETKKYHVGMMDVEDAKCAICLTAYEEGDDIRFLPCSPKKHHFHNACVDEWLRINGTCPFCKKSVDTRQ
jgi:hypothetical protein